MKSVKKGIVAVSGGNTGQAALIKELLQQDAAELRKVERSSCEAKEEQIRKAKIWKSICPVCDAKLIRGKKDKKNGYKREWTCSNCNKKHCL